MPTSPLASGIHFAALPSLENYASSANRSKLAKTDVPQTESNLVESGSANASNSSSVGADFEAMFVSLMLKQMRSSMTEDGLFGGDSSDTYGGIFDLYLGKHIAKSQPLGIGEMVKSYTESRVGS